MSMKQENVGEKNSLTQKGQAQLFSDIGVCLKITKKHLNSHSLFAPETYFNRLAVKFWYPH